MTRRSNRHDRHDAPLQRRAAARARSNAHLRRHRHRPRHRCSPPNLAVVSRRAAYASPRASNLTYLLTYSDHLYLLFSDPLGRRLE